MRFELLGVVLLLTGLLSGCSRPGEEAHLRASAAADEGVAAQQVINAAGPPSRTVTPDEECRKKGGARTLIYDVAAGWLNASPDHTLELCVDGSDTIVNRAFADIHGGVPLWTYPVYLLVLFLPVWQGARCSAARAVLLAAGLFVADLALIIALEFAGPAPSSTWLSVVLFLTVFTTVHVALVAGVIHRLTRRLVVAMALGNVLTLGLNLLV